MTVVTAVNYWAVLVAGIVYFLLGGLWYSKILFANAWMKAIDMTEEKAKSEYSPWKMVWAFIGSMLSAYGVARVLSFISGVTALGGLIIGLLIGLHFVFPMMSVNNAMEGRKAVLTAINVAYNMLGLIIMGIIIGAWR
jgi:hypothetical protein